MGGGGGGQSGGMFQPVWQGTGAPSGGSSWNPGTFSLNWTPNFQGAQTPFQSPWGGSTWGIPSMAPTWGGTTGFVPGMTGNPAQDFGQPFSGTSLGTTGPGGATWNAQSNSWQVPQPGQWKHALSGSGGAITTPLDMTGQAGWTQMPASTMPWTQLAPGSQIQLESGWLQGPQSPSSNWWGSMWAQPQTGIGLSSQSIFPQGGFPDPTSAWMFPSSFSQSSPWSWSNPWNAGLSQFNQGFPTDPIFMNAPNSAGLFQGQTLSPSFDPTVFSLFPPGGMASTISSEGFFRPPFVQIGLPLIAGAGLANQLVPSMMGTQQQGGGNSGGTFGFLPSPGAIVQGIQNLPNTLGGLLGTTATGGATAATPAAEAIMTAAGPSVEALPASVIAAAPSVESIQAATQAASGTGAGSILPGIGALANVGLGAFNLAQGNIGAGAGQLGGTALGAGIGSIVPGVGTLLGAAIGGGAGGLLGGLFGGGGPSEAWQTFPNRLSGTLSGAINAANQLGPALDAARTQSDILTAVRTFRNAVEAAGVGGFSGIGATQADIDALLRAQQTASQGFTQLPADIFVPNEGGHTFEISGRSAQPIADQFFKDALAAGATFQGAGFPGAIAPGFQFGETVSPEFLAQLAQAGQPRLQYLGGLTIPGLPGATGTAHEGGLVFDPAPLNTALQQALARARARIGV